MNKKFIIIFIIVVFIYTDIYSQIIHEIYPENPYVGTEVIINGEDLGDPMSVKFFINHLMLNEYPLNIITWNNNTIKFILPDINEKNLLFIFNKNKKDFRELYANKLINVKYFNPVKYTVTNSIDIKKIINKNNIEGKIYLYIPQPILSDELRSVETVYINPEPDYIQDNGVLLYIIDPFEAKKFEFRQTFEIITYYKKYDLDTIDFTNPITNYDQSSPVYKYYTREVPPFIIPDNKIIKKKLREIIGWKERNPAEKVNLIHLWVGKKMRHKYPPDDRDPVSVIESGEGDCLSDTFLYSTLIRSAGIPIRLVSGYIFYHELKLVGKHFWQEIFIPGVGWIPMDISYSHNRSFLRSEDFQSDTGFYFGGIDGRRMAFSKGRIRLLKPDKNGNLVYNKYIWFFQNPHIEVSDKKMNIYYQLKHKMKLKDYELLYDDSSDWFLLNKNDKKKSEN